MKHKMFLLFLFALLQTVKSQTAESDTVWVKKIGSEVKAVKFSPDGQFIYAGAVGRKLMKLSTETGEILREYEGVTIDLNARYIPLDISSDGTFLISGDYDNKMIVWDAQTGNILKTLNTNYSNNQNNKFNVVSISKDMRYVIATNMYWQSSEIFVNSLLIWDYQSGELLKEIQSRHLTKVEISPDNQYFAVSYERSEGSTILPSEIDLYEMGTWNKVITLGKHETKVSDISFSSDGSLLASCGWDGIIKIWDVEQKNMVREIKDELYGYSVGFIDNNKIIYGGGFFDQKFMKIFDIPSNVLLGKLKIDHPVDMDINNSKHFCVVANSDYILLFDYLSLITGINESDTNGKDLIKPNPTNNICEINFFLPLSGEIIVSILDANSREIKILYNDFLEKGEHKFQWIPKGVSSGVYYCRITGNNFSKTLKIILEK
jgi:WD40 repeat protein